MTGEHNSQGFEALGRRETATFVCVGCGAGQYILVALRRWWWWPRNISGGSEQADLAKDLSPPEVGDGKRKQERGRKKIVVDAT